MSILFGDLLLVLGAELVIQLVIQLLTEQKLLIISVLPESLAQITHTLSYVSFGRLTLDLLLIGILIPRDICPFQKHDSSLYFLTCTSDDIHPARRS